MNTSYHIPVLLAEAVQYLALKPHGVYIDATYGGGGHTQAILHAHPTCQVIACDWDEQSLEQYGEPLRAEFPDRLTLVWTNFARIGLHLKRLNINKVDGVLADFGTSRFQIETGAGFSCSRDTPLDMRMSPGHQQTTAAMMLAQADVRELTHIIGTYGEEPYAKAIAEAIVMRRKTKHFSTTTDLARVIESAVSRQKSRSRIHPATRTFQALRIVVNKELENISGLLAAARSLLHAGGRLVCISFHSLEDRLIKQEITEQPHLWHPVIRGVVKPAAEELLHNPSSRSARLRAAERC